MCVSMYVSDEWGCVFFFFFVFIHCPSEFLVTSLPGNSVSYILSPGVDRLSLSFGHTTSDLTDCCSHKSVLYVAMTTYYCCVKNPIVPPQALLEDMEKVKQFSSGGLLICNC